MLRSDHATADIVMELIREGLSKKEIIDVLGCDWSIVEGRLRQTGFESIKEARLKSLKPKRKHND